MLRNAFKPAHLSRGSCGKGARMIEAGLDWLDVGILPKGDPRKVQIAKVRTKTCVPLSFVGRELSMGTPMNVSTLTDRKKYDQATIFS